MSIFIFLKIKCIKSFWFINQINLLEIKEPLNFIKWIRILIISFLIKEKGLFYSYGRDKSFRPIVYGNFDRYDPNVI